MMIAEIMSTPATATAIVIVPVSLPMNASSSTKGIAETNMTNVLAITPWLGFIRWYLFNVYSR